MKNLARRLSFVALVASLSACGSASGSAGGDWAGTMDTLPSGQVVVANTADPLWRSGEEWQVIERVRIGTLEGTGPDVFGSIVSIERDGAGRVYVLEAQSQEIRVFERNGDHVRTIGRKGGGPGEFAEATMIELGPDGNLWVPDPQNNRVSVFDTAGAFVRSHPSPGGFIIRPWPGGFDDEGLYYSPVFVPAEDDPDRSFKMALARFDSELQPIDTLFPPAEPYDPDSRRLVLRSEDGNSVMMAGIPFTPRFRWRLARDGTFWSLISGEYKLFQSTPEGDTLRTITREFDPYPVTADDVDAAMEQLEWFIQQGGKVSRSRIPSEKPPTDSFFFDDEGNLWVERVTTAEDEARLMDVFDPVGRYLGEVRLPFRLAWDQPIIRDSTMWALTTDEFDVPYVVRASIVKPGAEAATTTMK